MPRYWVIAPFESKRGEHFDAVWDFDLNNGLLSIGWAGLGDVSAMTREELAHAVATTFPEKPQQTKGLYVNMIWAFYHDVKPGDFVIARRGRKVLAAAGRVSCSASYEPGRNPACNHPNFIEVSWSDEPRNKAFPTVVFPMHTIAETTEEQFRYFTEGTDPTPSPTLVPSVEDTTEFVLEKYLEDFIVSNFDTIFKGTLQIYVDADGNEGQQYTTDIGSIDILAIEPSSRSFVVIELKKGRPSDQVVGQILRYMGWVRKHLCTDGQAVKGLVICRESDTKLSYALEMTVGIDVRYYSVSFKLTETPHQ